MHIDLESERVREFLEFVAKNDPELQRITKSGVEVIIGEVNSRLRIYLEYSSPYISHDQIRKALYDFKKWKAWLIKFQGPEYTHETKRSKVIRKFLLWAKFGKDPRMPTKQITKDINEVIHDLLLENEPDSLDRARRILRALGMRDAEIKKIISEGESGEIKNFDQWPIRIRLMHDLLYRSKKRL